MAMMEEVTIVHLAPSRVVLPEEVCQQRLHRPAEIVVDLEVLVHQPEVVEAVETNNQIPSVFLKEKASTNQKLLNYCPTETSLL